ncbi:MAG: hypothetical protein ABW110_01265 [Steroidobacteraceae bacterium]
MKARSIVALIAGGLVWAFLFPSLVWLVSLFWPALDKSLEIFRQTHRYDVFSSTSILLLFQLLWAITNCTVGFVATLISKRKTEALILMAILVAYFAFRHFWTEWDQFPAWYNVLVVVLAAPMVVVGATISELIRSDRRPDEPVAVG